jgi:transcription elongation factor S-II
MPLDAKAVEQKGKELVKAAGSGGAAAPALLSLLDELRRGVAATEALLRTTRIGVAVNKLRQHKDDSVKRAAAELVGKWRADVSRLRGGAAAAGSSGASTPKPGGGVNGGAVASPHSTSPLAKVEKVKLSVPKDKRTHKTDGVQWAVTKSDGRNNCVRLMYDGLAYMSEEGNKLHLSSIHSSPLTRPSPRHPHHRRHSSRSRRLHRLPP